MWNADLGYESTLAAFETSLKKLGLDYLDLYLIHWPVASKYKDAWRALEKLYKDGRVKSIGVSNFQVHHLEDLMKDAEIIPVVNQVEFHPLLNQKEPARLHEEARHSVGGVVPLMQESLLNHPLLKEIADKYGKSIAQVILRWDLQHGVVTIPKSTKEHRIVENASLFDFELSPKIWIGSTGLTKTAALVLTRTTSISKPVSWSASHRRFESSRAHQLNNELALEVVLGTIQGFAVQKHCVGF